MQVEEQRLSEVIGFLRYLTRLGRYGEELLWSLPVARKEIGDDLWRRVLDNYDKNASSVIAAELSATR